MIRALSYRLRRGGPGLWFLLLSLAATLGIYFYTFFISVLQLPNGRGFLQKPNWFLLPVLLATAYWGSVWTWKTFTGPAWRGITRPSRGIVSAKTATKDIYHSIDRRLELWHRYALIFSFLCGLIITVCDSWATLRPYWFKAESECGYYTRSSAKDEKKEGEEKVGDTKADSPNKARVEKEVLLCISFQATTDPAIEKAISEADLSIIPLPLPADQKNAANVDGLILFREGKIWSVNELDFFNAHLFGRWLGGIREQTISWPEGLRSSVGGNFFLGCLCYLLQGYLIGLIILSTLNGFLNTGMLIYLRRYAKELRVRLDPLSPHLDFGLYSWNRAVNNFYGLFAVLIAASLISRLAQLPGEIDFGQVMLRLILPLVVFVHFAFEIFVRRYLYYDLAGDVYDFDEAGVELFQNQSLWPFSRDPLGRLSVLSFGGAYAVAGHDIVALIFSSL